MKVYALLGNDCEIIGVSKNNFPGIDSLVEIEYDESKFGNITDGYHFFINGEIVKKDTMSNSRRNMIIEALRVRRENECFKIVNRGSVWYNNMTDSERDDITRWYRAWLDVTETLEAPEKPKWLK